MFRVELRGERVSVLHMDDGKVNAMGPAFVEAFPAAWTEATASGRAVVLAGNAKAFGAGLDLKTLPTLDRAQLVAFARGFMGVFREIVGYERPVVAAVDGAALAGGAILALAADFRLVGPRAKLGLTEVPVGIPFPSAVADLARAKLPPQEHAPTILLGAVREGEACVRAGWAQRATSSEALLDEAVALADELAAFSPVAYTSGKRALHLPLVAEFDDFAKEEAEAWVDLILREDTREAIAAYFARATGKK